jgi:murein peptide amidase A
VNGVPIFAREVPPPSPGTNKPKRILMVGGIHGDELTSVEIAFTWLARLGDAQARQHHWKVVPLLNPDGFLIAKPTRMNARGVDLNRNFPTPNWAKEAKKYWEVTTGKDPRRFPGTQPLSEPESRWLDGQLKSFKPDVVISIHAPLGLLDFDGPPPPPRKIGRLFLDQIGLYPGSLGNYAGLHRGVPVVTLELPNAQEMVSEAEQNRMWEDLLEWLNKNIQAREAKPSSPPPATSAPDASRSTPMPR